MKTGLAQALRSGELLKHKPIEFQEMQGPPSSSLSSNFHWNRLDPSETIVLNQETILKVNDLITRQMEKQRENASTDSSSQEKPTLAVSDILRRCHEGISSDLERKKILKKRRYEEFLKYLQEPCLN